MSAGLWRVERLVNGRWCLAAESTEHAAEAYYRKRAAQIETGAIQLVRPDGLPVASTWCTKHREAA